MADLAPSRLGVAERPTPPPAHIGFVGQCPTCPDWTGPTRTSSLAALRDFDRHAETSAHALGVIAATMAPDLCPDCGHDPDEHDRRAEDGGGCDRCVRDGGPCAA